MAPTPEPGSATTADEVVASVRDRRVTLKGVRTIPTMLVKLKDSGTVCRINESKYDPALHSKVKPTVPTPTVPTDAEGADNPADESSPSNGAPTAEDLMRLTNEELTALPQWENVEGRSQLTRKEDKVAALLAVWE